MRERPRVNVRKKAVKPKVKTTDVLKADHTVAKTALLDFRHTDVWPHVRAYLLSKYPELPAYTQTEESVTAWIRVSNQREGFDKLFSILGVVKDA